MIKAIVLRDAVDAIIVTDVSRLSRHAEALARTVDWLAEHDVAIYLVSDGAYYRPGL
ncbi:MAG: recombinase family protein [Candidatus Nealsonbacteria bacterium]|nr:recombinase family protein [Candidatus Nealsonbacteria bacterium]